MDLGRGQFDEFFQALYGYTPFRWQSLLARRVAEGGWPPGIDLPPASGKTACLDIAVYAFALSGDGSSRSSRPRRIFFVVDRRIVVDEACDRAESLRRRLQEPTSPIVEEVADRLKKLAGTNQPLVVARMRGGVRREDVWVDNPAQPTIITSTVDQVGSRLLFRGYGPGRRSQSIHAGLLACDSLILLDEAHCAVPFMQTADAVRRYTGEQWMDEGVTRQGFVRPLTFVILSATLPPEIPQNRRFPRGEAERQQVLDDPNLRPRVETEKPASLAVAKKPGKRDWALGTQASDDVLVLDAAQRAAYLIEQGRKRVAVMVNRVATAAAIHRQLRDGLPAEKAHIVLLTGRMRPIDRDRLVDQWSPVLKVNPECEPPRPVVLVTTQCLEVGADFSFDALVTECASLDALRQRFGRLNRLGDAALETSAAILIGRKPTAKSLKGDEREKLREDWIYDTALEATWLWLQEQAGQSATETIDMSTASVGEMLKEHPPEDGLPTLLAPRRDAPVLLPAHLDFLCQTSPRPTPDPDVALFLHGPQRGVPEARVVFRADFSDSDAEAVWLDTVGLLPPVAAEALSVPLWRLRRWLAGQDLGPDETGDVEGQRVEDETQGPRVGRRFLLWRGRRRGGQRSRCSQSPGDVQPDDTVVVAADSDWIDRLGHYFTRPDEEARLDVAEEAYLRSKKRAVLRINPRVLGQWKSAQPIANLLDWAGQEDRETGALADSLAAVADYQPPQDETDLPPWLHEVARQCRDKPRIESHPAGGVILLGASKAVADGEDEFRDEDDTTSVGREEVRLTDHTAHVVTVAHRFASRCLPAELVEDLALAARLHDLGKADERFQVLLRGRWPTPQEIKQPLGKSTSFPRSLSGRHRLAQKAELPEDFRHEMLSMQLAESFPQLPEDPQRRDLLLHLIASHHGYGRPFAPVCVDDNPPDIEIHFDSPNGGMDLTLSAERHRVLTPPHRIDSGVAERFWRLTRRYGWWGLAYLEAILRLADWHASAAAATGSDTTGNRPDQEEMNRE